MYLGKMQELTVITANNAPNNSVICFGVSGTGKTCRMNQIELAEAKQGKTVIVLDMHQTHEVNQIFSPIAPEYESIANRISIIQDGISLNFLQMNQGTLSEYTLTVNSAVASLSRPFSFGVKQMVALREAVIFAIEHQSQFIDNMVAIGAGLQRQNTVASQCVLEKMWTLLSLSVFHGCKRIYPGCINIVSFAGMDIMTQELLGEIILSFLWRNAMFFGQGMEKDLIISLDEFHGMDLRRESTLRAMLCEGRKFHVRLLMATQSLNVFKNEEQAILDQAGTKLYFRPGDNEIKKIYRRFGTEDTDNIAKKLSSLQVGESLVSGMVLVNGLPVNRAIIVN